MTCNVITHGTKKYALAEILVYDSSKNLWVSFHEGIGIAEPECEVNPSAVSPADEADNLIIQLGASEFPLAAADVSTNTRYTFNSSGLNWSVGDSVVVKLIDRAPAAPPIEPPHGFPHACSETPDVSDMTAPSLTGAQVDGATVTLEFDEAICGGAGSALFLNHFQVTVNGSAWRVNKIAYAGSTVTLTLQRAVTASDAVSIRYSPDSFITGTNPTPLDDIEKLNDLNHNLVTDLRLRTANDSLANVTPAPPIEPPHGYPQPCSATPDASDTTAPSLTGAQIDGATVTLEFDEAICGGAGSALLRTHFLATVNGSAWRVDRIAYAGSTVTLTLQRAVTASDAVSIRYSPDSFITGTNPTPLDDIEKLNDLNHNLVTDLRLRTANDSLNNVMSEGDDDGGGTGDGGTGGSGFGGGVPQNGPPEYTDGDATDRSIAENTADGADIGAPVAALDHEGDTVTYSLRGPDATSFDIDDATGQLRTKAPLDYEAKAAYSVIVVAKSASGGGRGYAYITVTINVEDVALPGIANDYDMNGNERIDRDEVLVAVDDYYADLITKEEVVVVVIAYFKAMPWKGTGG